MVFIFLFSSFKIFRFRNIWLLLLLLFSKLVRFKKWLNSFSVYFLFKIIFNNSSISIHIFIKVWHPYHYKFIFSTSCKIISFLVEFYRFNFSFMSKNCPSQPTLFKIPYFNFAIIWNWWHMISVWMKCQSINSFLMSIVMLNQLPQSCIP